MCFFGEWHSAQCLPQIGPSPQGCAVRVLPVWCCRSLAVPPMGSRLPQVTPGLVISNDAGEGVGSSLMFVHSTPEGWRSGECVCECVWEGGGRSNLLFSWFAFSSVPESSELLLALWPVMVSSQTPLLQLLLYLLPHTQLPSWPPGCFLWGLPSLKLGKECTVLAGVTASSQKFR